MRVIARLFAGVLVGLAAVSLVACSSPAPGEPRAADAEVTTTASDTNEPPRSSTTRSTLTKPASPLDTVEPCELLSAAEVAQLGTNPGEPDKLGNIPGCGWQKSGDFTVGVALHGTRGFTDANLHGATPTPVEVGRHEAHRVENLGGGDGGCDVFVVVSESSFVQVSGIASGRRDTPKACGKAMLVARLIDPKLP